MPPDPGPLPPNVQHLIESLKAPQDHPGAETLRHCAAEITRWSLEEFLTLDRQSLGQSASRTDLEALLRQPPPEEGEEFRHIFGQFQDHVAPYTMRLGHPRFLAFIPSAPNYFSILGEGLCASLNCFAGVWLEGAGAATVELLVLDWFKEFLGYPPEARGILTGGGSEANLTALVVAREQLPVTERARAVLYESDQRHHSLDRAAKIIGLLPEQIRLLPADGDFLFRAGTLEQAVAADRARGLIPWLVVANAGATNTGLVDPLDELGACCRRHRLWLHADAAYGWAAVLTPEGKKWLRGIEQADSIALDPHKWFAQAFDAGCVLVRRGGLLAETFAAQPEYMRDVAASGEEVNFADYGLALTRRFRALKIWLSLKVLGVKWFRELVERGLALAELTETLLRRSGVFEVLSPRGLSTVCFRYRASKGDAAEEDLNALNLALLEALRRTGRFFLTSTRLRGRVALRCCFVNWRTTSADVLELVELLTQLGIAV